MICGNGTARSCSHCPQYNGCNRSYEYKCEMVVARICAEYRQIRNCNVWDELDVYAAAKDALFGGRPLWG